MGQIISYEEYYPYGSTSYQAVHSQTEAAKRYRYTGMERDEESGLEYHRARYYAAWLGRWSSPDPAGLADGPCIYEYVTGNPINKLDPSGKGFWDIVDKFTDVLVPIKPFIKAVAKGDVDDAIGLANPLPLPPSVKLGLWDAEKDMAKGLIGNVKRAALGPVVEGGRRIHGALTGSLSDAAPEVAGLVDIPRQVVEAGTLAWNGKYFR